MAYVWWRMDERDWDWESERARMLRTYVILQIRIRNWKNRGAYSDQEKQMLSEIRNGDKWKKNEFTDMSAVKGAEKKTINKEK